MQCINTPVLNFSTVEGYNGDWVMRQFGCRQFVSVEPQQFADVHGHDYKCGNQPMGELEDQHMVNLTLNTSDQWVDVFSDESQSSSCHPYMGGSTSYHLDMGSSSSYHPDIGGSSSFLFTSPQATFDPAFDPLDMYNRPQRPPRQ
ncbi:hypothetical protein GOBAR_DD09661 [Gossypium barbadense]|nr:hypothetical protein GOBAR_DD09661 [Gossypium barbadense]